MDELRAGTVQKNPGEGKRQARSPRRITDLARGTNLFFGPRVPGRKKSMNVDVAGTGFDAHCRAAATDLAGDMVAIRRALCQHFGVCMNRA
jgi:hypothetical protein